MTTQAPPEIVELIARMDRGMELIEAARSRGDTAEEDRLLAHWARLDDQYRALWDAQQGGA